MPHMKLDLSDARAKLDHAEAHINLLWSGIKEICGEDPYAVPLRRQYEADQGAVVYRIDRVVDIPEEWSLVLGDAVHDLRSALDHLMWQLARRRLGRNPTEREAKQIQFPCVKRGKELRANRFLDSADIQRISRFQPYKRLNKGQLHPLPKIVRLDDRDKHRRLHLLVTIPFQSPFSIGDEAYRDCVPAPRVLPGQTVPVHGSWVAPSRNPKPDDVAFAIWVTPTGPKPDVDLDMSLVAHISVGRLGPVVPVLDGFAQYVANVLDGFS